ncbi:MAG: AI-2E family transporter [Chloroflexi bacterium]|nr:AI-2E family transporter [Chloroflexota bacterium]
MTKQLVIYGTAVMTALLALLALWQFRIVVVYVLISLALAATVRPFITHWSSSGWMKRLLLVVICLISLGILGFLLVLSVETAINEIGRLLHTVSVQDRWMLPIWLQGSSFQKILVAQLPSPSKLFEAFTGDQGQLVLPAIIGFTQGIGNIMSAILVIFFLSLYWSINQIHFERLWLSLLPSDQRKQARRIWRTIEPDLGAYIRSELFQSLLAGLLLGIGYWLLGSPYPTLLALAGALAWLIPVVGAPLAVILPLIMGLLTSVQFSLFTALYTLVVLLVLQLWVEPRLFKRKWDNPILTLVILLAMADAFGLVGILVAPPLSAVCQILWSRLVSNPLTSGAALQVSDLKERQAHLSTAINGMDELPPPLVMSSMERLTLLLEKAESILPALPPPELSIPFHPSQPVTAEAVSPDPAKP